MNLLRKFFISIFLIGMSYSGMAWWGLTGHRVVGAIAENYLNSKAKNAIREILGDESLAMAANWPDFIKSDSDYSYLGPWHYLNVQGGLDKPQFMDWLAKDTGTDAYTKLNFLIAELKKSDLPADQKKMYLRLVIHIVGDIHQPLHVGHLDDLGGNKIKVTWFNESTNLHSVWDDRLIDFQKLSYTEFSQSINHVTKQQRKEWQQQPLSEWLYESYTLAAGIYAEITQPDQKLMYRYNFDHIQTIQQQLLKAGVRLAGLLNSIFG